MEMEHSTENEKEDEGKIASRRLICMAKKGVVAHWTVVTDFIAWCFERAYLVSFV